MNSSSIQKLSLKIISKSNCDLISGRKFRVLLKKNVSQSQNKDRKEKYDKYKCHCNWQRRVVPTFINISHLVIGINLNYLHPKFCINVWCQPITYAHFVFSVRVLTKYCNLKIYHEKFLWRIAVQTRKTWKIPTIQKCSK